MNGIFASPFSGFQSRHAARAMSSIDTLKQNVTLLMRRRGWTSNKPIIEASKRLGGSLSNGTLGRIRQEGGGNVTLHQVDELARVFDLQPQQLLSPAPDIVAVDESTGSVVFVEAKTSAWPDSRPERAENLSDALGNALLGLPASMRSRSVDACRLVAEAPDSQLARCELWDVLQHSAALKQEEPKERRRESPDALFREAFYTYLDKSSSELPERAREILTTLRNTLEERVAEELQIDIDQARRSLNARQYDQG